MFSGSGPPEPSVAWRFSHSPTMRCDRSAMPAMERPNSAASGIRNVDSSGIIADRSAVATERAAGRLAGAPLGAEGSARVAGSTRSAGGAGAATGARGAAFLGFRGSLGAAILASFLGRSPAATSGPHGR